MRRRFAVITTNTIPKNEIWYTSMNGDIVEPYKKDVFGSTIISNTSENGKGRIIFDRDVTAIGMYAFYSCDSLISITIPNSVTSIGTRAFDSCDSLISITIPNSITAIVMYAFYYCRSLTSVTIPNSVTSIGSNAFATCDSLISVYCKPTTPPSGGELMFYDNASGRKIYVPRASVNAYKQAEYWSAYADDIVGYDF